MPDPTPLRLLGPDDPPPVEVINAEGKAPLVVICDHASWAIPRAMAGLGICEGEQCRHIGWDIGAAEVARGLAVRLDGPALLAGYSRLVIDLNRTPGHPTSIPPESDCTAIPGNGGLSDAEVEARLDTFFWPYHHAITDTLGRQWRHTGLAPALVAVHSFTPVMNGFRRPWHVGVLWNHDPRMALPLMERLHAVDGLVVGDNEPYSGRDIGYTIDRHAGAAGLPHVSVEIRQDLIDSDAGVARWIDLLGDVLADLLADARLHRAELF